MTGAAALLVAMCALSLAVGSRWIPPTDVAHALVSPVTDDIGRIVVGMRVPRTVAALVVGVGLGVAGAVIQALTRNPLGDPGLLGVNAGASVAVAVGVVLFGTTTTLQDTGFAAVGALLVTVAVFAIGASGRVDPVRLTLAGAATAAVLTGVMTGLTLWSPRGFDRLRSWNAGTLVERGWEVIAPTAPVVVAGAVLAWSIGRSLNALGMGDDLAVALGARVGRTRALSVLAVTLLAGGATALAGPLGFIGLMVPHAARRLVGPDQRGILAVSALLGPLVVLGSDIVGRVALFPSEVPVGVMCAFIGGPALIAVARRMRTGTS